jgi:hypothetical protein
MLDGTELNLCRAYGLTNTDDPPRIAMRVYNVPIRPTARPGSCEDVRCRLLGLLRVACGDGPVRLSRFGDELTRNLKSIGYHTAVFPGTVCAHRPLRLWS